MATTKRSPADRVRALLTKNKALTEKEVLDRVKGTSRKEIRALRVALGIDRQSAIADARGRLAKEPGLPAARLIGDIFAAYGVRLGAPDVSRLRPVKAKTGRRPKGVTLELREGVRKAYSAMRQHQDKVMKPYALFPTAEQELNAVLAAKYLEKMANDRQGSYTKKAAAVRRAVEEAVESITTKLGGKR